MSDIAIEFNEELFFDMVLENGDLKVDDGLETSILISLFTDQKPDDTIIDLPSGEDDLRGWWGDEFLDDPLDSTGGLMWLFLRGKVTNQNLNDLKKAALDSLSWMIDDGVASSVDFFIIQDGQFQVNFRIEIEKPDGSIDNFKYFFNWQTQELKRIS